MSDILFVTWDGGGNVGPALGIAAELTRRQHTVRVLGHPQQRATVEAASHAFTSYVHARPWSSLDPLHGMRGATRVVSHVFTDRGIGKDLLATADRYSPDLIVIDCLLFGALQAANRAGLRYTTLVHSLYSQQSKQWNSGIPALLTRSRGLNAADLWRHSDTVLVTTSPVFEAPGQTPANVRFIGPVWPDLRPTPATHNATDPFILVSLSTIYQEGHEQTYQAILDALADLPAHALVTTGPSVDPHALHAPANVEVKRFAPHATVMSGASLVVGHGGYGTTMLALAHDLPLVILPMFELGDQPEVAHTVERLGAARVLPKTARAAAIRNAIQQILSDGRYREAARTLGAQLRQRDGAVEGADALEPALILSPA